METMLAKYVFNLGQCLDKVEPQKQHFFFEAGANDGVSFSNTYELEKLGWDGILVEPSPAAYECLIGTRSCKYKFNCALGDGSAELVEGYFVQGSLMGSCDEELIGRDPNNLPLLPRLLRSMKRQDASESRIDGVARALSNIGRLVCDGAMSRKCKVPARTITDILHSTHVDRVDIMTLDIEGYEAIAIKGISRIDPSKPRILIVETRRRDAMEISEMLLSLDYILFANLSRFEASKDPDWTGDHQDFLWVDGSDQNAIVATKMAFRNKAIIQQQMTD